MVSRHVLTLTKSSPLTPMLNIDNTNADLKAREYWTSLANSLEIPIRCVHFTAPAKLCEHNDAYRAIGGLLHGVCKRPSLTNCKMPKTMQRLLTLRGRSDEPRIENYAAETSFHWFCRQICSTNPGRGLRRYHEGRI